MKSLIRSAAYRGTYATISALNRVVPKREQAIVYSFPDYAPNAIAMSNALLEYTDLDVVWLVRDVEKAPPLSLVQSDRITVANHQSPLGIAAFTRAKYVFSTHGIYGDRSAKKGQTTVQLWHGMPLKPIGALDGQPSLGEPTWVVAASPFWTSFLAGVFEVRPDQVVSTGLPRDELLLAQPTDTVRSALEKLVGVRPYAKLLVWLPTYRASVVGDVRVDGSESGNTVQAEDFDPEPINEALKRQDTVCLVKRHPMSPTYEEADYSNLIFVTDDHLGTVGLDLYSLLALSDGLITDLSSVWIDYLVTGKPILFFFPDLDAYRVGRGLLHEPYGEFVPGRLVEKAAELPAAFDSFWDEAPLFAKDRERSRRRLNSDGGQDSALRLLHHLGVAKPTDSAR